jgi:hypothetical protein
MRHRQMLNVKAPLEQISLSKLPPTSLSCIMSILSSTNFEMRMKRFLSILAFLLVSFAFVAAQGNGGNNGNGNWNGNGNNGNGNGSAVNAQQWLLTYLQNGNPVPTILALDIIRQARDWGMQVCGLNLGQMIQKYFQGQLTVTFMSTSPPSMTFRVSYGGNDVLIIDSL